MAPGALGDRGETLLPGAGCLPSPEATRMAPAASMLVALMTYTLQVALVALVFVMLTSSGAVGTTLTAGWLAAGRGAW